MLLLLRFVAACYKNTRAVYTICPQQKKHARAAVQQLGEQAHAQQRQPTAVSTRKGVATSCRSKGAAERKVLLVERVAAAGQGRCWNHIPSCDSATSILRALCCVQQAV